MLAEAWCRIEEAADRRAVDVERQRDQLDQAGLGMVDLDDIAVRHDLRVEVQLGRHLDEREDDVGALLEDIVPFETGSGREGFAQYAGQLKTVTVSGSTITGVVHSVIEAAACTPKKWIVKIAVS